MSCVCGLTFASYFLIRSPIQLPLALCGGTQGDANFRASLHKYVITTPLYRHSSFCSAIAARSRIKLVSEASCTTQHNTTGQQLYSLVKYKYVGETWRRETEMNILGSIRSPLSHFPMMTGGETFQCSWRLIYWDTLMHLEGRDS